LFIVSLLSFLGINPPELYIYFLLQNKKPLKYNAADKFSLT